MILQIASIEEDMGKRKKISFQYVSFCILENLYCKHVLHIFKKFTWTLQ